MGRPRKLRTEELLTQHIEPHAPKFDKKKIVSSKRFAKYRDLVNVLLKEGEQYTVHEVEQCIKDFLDGKYTLIK